MNQTLKEQDEETSQAIRDYQAGSESVQKVGHKRVLREKGTFALSKQEKTAPNGDIARTEAVRGAKLDNDRVQDENAMRRRLMKWTLIVVSAQIVLSDILVIIYAIFKYRIFHQAVSDKLVATWITVTVVQTIGILAIIARGLFNRRERH